jgi:polyisoprenoid-binding protein YceI
MTRHIAPRCRQNRGIRVSLPYQDILLDVLLPVGTYRIAPAPLSVSFTTRHFFGLGRVTGSLTVVDSEIHVADPLGASVPAQVTASSFTSGIGMRDLQVKWRMFRHARKHPFLTLTSPRRSQRPTARAIQGLLTARGTTAASAATAR